MAIGDVTYNQGGSGGGNAFRAVKLLDAASATNGQPSLVTDGVPVYPQRLGTTADTGASFTGRASLESSIFIKGTGTGTVAGTFRMWGYLAALGVWVPVGATPAGDTTKGLLNAGAAIGETKTDTVLHCEPFLQAGHFDRLYLEITATSGSSLSFDAWLVTAHRRNF